MEQDFRQRRIMNLPQFRLDNYLQAFREGVIGNAGNDGVIDSGPLPLKVQEEVDKLIGIYKENVQPDMTEVYLFSEEENIDLFLTDPGYVRKAFIFTGKHKENEKMGVYIRYVTKTAERKVVRDNYVDLGVFANPPNYEELMQGASPNSIQIIGGELKLNKDKKAGSKLRLDKVIEKIYRANDK